ncbi:hypothetical protein GCM10009839_73940 [Catenulispora yoronensis]|uniref:Lipoprotein n=1 Tax=Catenulispora yoronensis TaxID=450799 RepID=A0ABN2V835_9ACTN
MRASKTSPLALGLAAVLVVCPAVAGCTRSGAHKADVSKTPEAKADPPFVTAHCRTSEPVPPSADQITIGKVVLPSMPDLAAYGPNPEPGDDGVTFYKGGIAVHADQPSVTISIGAAALPYARIATEDFIGPLGATAVTYTGKPRIEAEKTWDCWYVGGYNLLDRRTTACLPLDVAIAGDPVVHHVTVPVGMKCPTG